MSPLIKIILWITIPTTIIFSIAQFGPKSKIKSLAQEISKFITSIIFFRSMKKEDIDNCFK
jgi:hypothetical protein